MNQAQQKPNWVVIILVAALVFFVFKSYNNGGDSPSPDPRPIPNNVAEITERASNQYNILLSKDMETLASQVGASTLKTSKQLQDKARELTAKSREQAFMPVSELDNKFIPMEINQDNKASVYEYLMEKAKGHEKAGK